MLEPQDSERDINDIFDDIVLTEERLVAEGYREGFLEGCKQGEADGYRLGFAKGLQIGEELAKVYGFIIALQQEDNQTEKVIRCMEQLKLLIEQFPKENHPEADIVGSLEQIRIVNKKLLILLGIKSDSLTNSASEESKALSF